MRPAADHRPGLGQLFERRIGKRRLELAVRFAQLGQQRDRFVGKLLRRDVVQRRLDLRERPLGPLLEALRIECGDAVVRRRQELVQIIDDAFDVEVMDALQNLARRIDDLPDRGGRGRNVDIVGDPVDRQRRIIGGVDVVDLEIAGAGDPLRRELDAQAGA